MAERRNVDEREQDHTSDGVIVRVPLRISLKDVIWILGMVTTVVLAWGMIGTRLSLLEQKDVYRDREIQRLEKRLDEVESHERSNLESQQRNLPPIRR